MTTFTLNFLSLLPANIFALHLSVFVQQRVDVKSAPCHAKIYSRWPERDLHRAMHAVKGILRYFKNISKPESDL